MPIYVHIYLLSVFNGILRSMLYGCIGFWTADRLQAYPLLDSRQVTGLSAGGQALGAATAQ